LIETVRQDAANRLTTFDEEFIERRGRRTTRHRFTLTFRTIAAPDLAARLSQAGFREEARLGDYRGRPWREGAPAWLVLARRR
jgi:hypothetical protein